MITSTCIHCQQPVIKQPWLNGGWCHWTGEKSHERPYGPEQCDLFATPATVDELVKLARG